MPFGRAVSSAGRAPRLHRDGRRFESVTAHHLNLRNLIYMLSLRWLSWSLSLPKWAKPSYIKAPFTMIRPFRLVRQAHQPDQGANLYKVMFLFIGG